jgi:hypothetical protein
MISEVRRLQAMKRIASLVLILAAFALAGCGGSASPGTQQPVKQGKPLDPQGNWLFTFTGSTNPNQGSLVAGGELFELNPPVVTSNGLGAFQPSEIPGFPGSSCFGQYSLSGQASGENSITMTLAPTNTSRDSALAATLAGTIAVDQEHMSGTWTATQAAPCMGINTSGTWTAFLLAPVTGNWSGTVSNAQSDLLVTASLTENVDQTSPEMGKVTGTFTVSGSPCFPNAVTFSLPASFNDPNGVGAHGNIGLVANVLAVNGVRFEAVGFVATDASKINFQDFVIKGGSCDGQNFTGILGR